MSPLLVPLTMLVAIIFTGHATFLVCYLRRLRSDLGPLLGNDQCPHVAVVLCLRGHDPFLEACLDGLLSQDYPCFEVMIVVDNRADPAWEVAAKAVAEHPQAKVALRQLSKRRRSCSLKCSAIVQAVTEFEEVSQVDVYAFLDADVVPHVTWLRELVTPLASANVAASSGYRSFLPMRRTLASVLRAQWNCAAAPMMYLNRICWGGSLALRADFVRQARLLDVWSRALCEDSMIGPAARELKLRLALLPSLAMVNQESCSLAALFPWIRRQILFGFLYNPGFGVRNRIVTVVYNATVAGACALTFIEARQGNLWVLPLGLLLIAYLSLLIGGQWRIDTIVYKKALSRGQRARAPGAAWPVLLLLCLPLTQLVSLAAVLSTLRARVVSWRGIRYRVRGPLKIEKLERSSVRVRSSEAEERLDPTHSL